MAEVKFKEGEDLKIKDILNIMQRFNISFEQYSKKRAYYIKKYKKVNDEEKKV